MLRANEIKEAIGALLALRYPDRPRFTRLLPKDFERPSEYVEFLERSGEPGNIRLTEVTAKVRVVTFVPVDDYGDGDDEAADLAADELMELFLGSQVEAGGRSLDVTAVKTLYGADFGAVELMLSYMDDTPEPYGREPVPGEEYIKHVYINGEEIR